MNVCRNGQHIANSPFKIVVGESEIGNASRVKVYGKGLSEGMANEVNEFTVNTKEAGQPLYSVKLPRVSLDGSSHGVTDRNRRLVFSYSKKLLLVYYFPTWFSFVLVICKL